MSLDLLNKSAGNGDLGFTGHSETYDGLDCVAIFDGTRWRLELLKGSLKVRYVLADQSVNLGDVRLYIKTASPSCTGSIMEVYCVDFDAQALRV